MGLVVTLRSHFVALDPGGAVGQQPRRCAVPTAPTPHRGQPRVADDLVAIVSGRSRSAFVPHLAPYLHRRSAHPTRLLESRQHRGCRPPHRRRALDTGSHPKQRPRSLSDADFEGLFHGPGGHVTPIIGRARPWPCRRTTAPMPHRAHGPTPHRGQIRVAGDRWPSSLATHGSCPCRTSRRTRTCRSAHPPLLLASRQRRCCRPPHRRHALRRGFRGSISRAYPYAANGPRPLSPTRGSVPARPAARSPCAQPTIRTVTSRPGEPTHPPDSSGRHRRTPAHVVPRSGRRPPPKEASSWRLHLASAGLLLRPDGHVLAQRAHAVASPARGWSPWAPAPTGCPAWVAGPRLPERMSSLRWQNAITPSRTQIRLVSSSQTILPWGPRHHAVGPQRAGPSRAVRSRHAPVGCPHVRTSLSTRTARAVRSRPAGPPRAPRCPHGKDPACWFPAIRVGPRPAWARTGRASHVASRPSAHQPRDSARTVSAYSRVRPRWLGSARPGATTISASRRTAHVRPLFIRLVSQPATTLAETNPLPPFSSPHAVHT